MNDYETVINGIVATINDDPTKAKKEFNSAMNLATHVYVPNIDAIVLQCGVDDVAAALKNIGKSFFGYTIQDFRNAIKTLVKENNKKQTQEDITVQTLGSYPADCGEFVSMWVSRFASDVVWNYNDTITRNGVVISQDQILIEMRNCENSLKLKYGKDLLLANMKLFRQKMKHKRLDYFKSALAPKTDTNVIKQLRDACHGFFLDPEKAYYAILDFIWQVKRELFGLPIKYHHFLYIHSGDQGTGKTEFVRLLKKPLLDLSAECHLEKLFDPAYISFPEYYILFFDDVSKRLADFEISRLKEMITANHIPGRYFFSNDIQQIPRKFHGIATSNKPLSSVINDNQMRRFIDLEVRPLPKDRKVYEVGCVNQKEWDMIEAVDYGRLWKAVDHTGDTFLMKHKEDILCENDPLKFIDLAMSRWSVTK